MSKVWFQGMVICLTVQAVCIQASNGRQYDLLTPSSFSYQSEVYIGAERDGGVEEVKAYNTVWFSLGFYKNIKLACLVFPFEALVGSISSVQSSTTAMSTTVSSALYSLLTSSCSVSAKVQFKSGNSMDGYLPLPETSRGTEFFVSSWNSGTSFIAIRCGPQSATVTISVPASASPSTTVSVDDTTLTPGDSINVQILSNQELLLTSVGFALDGVRVSSTQPISVWAGNKDATVLGIGQATSLVEMFPSSDYFSTTYIAQKPTGVTLSMLKIVALTSGTTVTQTSAGNVVTSNTLAAVGDVWTVSQLGIVHFSATAPVLVVQYLPAVGASNYASMTLIPPADQWVSTYLVYALTAPATGTHLVSVAILTSQIPKLAVIRLSDGTDMTSLLSFSTFTGTSYSTAILDLTDSNVVQLSVSDGSATFQVVQYGGISGTDGAYAFPAGMLVSCNDSISSTTSASTTSAGSSRIVSFLPNAAFIALSAAATVAVLGFTAEALRRWKLSSRAQNVEKTQSKSFMAKSTPTVEYYGYHSNAKATHAHTNTRLGNFTVPVEQKYSTAHAPTSNQFRSRPPVEKSYIQVKPCKNLSG
ncbi:low quality protein: laminin-like protein epi-1 [Plakobranchus ocellatus]|uniref:Low quality protein: laminin-like protein epi-1 n=1 Tax=Plakobranchus ocellatus TaxID=259542 RepID=A0AAV4CW07_9GAST|nr:low quality protein: laminin-like protein epi-1 [Plakobranchus ocellatus]